MLQAIKDHKDQRGHDRCWLDDQKLYMAAGLLDASTALPPQEEFINNCRAYWENRQNPEHQYLNVSEEIAKATEPLVDEINQLTVALDEMTRISNGWKLAYQKLQSQTGIKRDSDK